ncbi:tetratricopeptide repeat protein [Streptomyces virginiae]|uniref:tetratricopeptide repeat protein n=1 Tax=Streptomyces virginiae TaxID=1961 RepID=UPI00352E9081
MTTEWEGSIPERALALLTAAGDRASAGAVLHQLGLLAQEQGDYEDAERHLPLALKMFEDLGDPDGSARALGQLGRSAWRPTSRSPPRHCSNWRFWRRH